MHGYSSEQYIPFNVRKSVIENIQIPCLIALESTTELKVQKSVNSGALQYREYSTYRASPKESQVRFCHCGFVQFAIECEVVGFAENPVIDSPNTWKLIHLLTYSRETCVVAQWSRI